MATEKEKSRQAEAQVVEGASLLDEIVQATKLSPYGRGVFDRPAGRGGVPPPAPRAGPGGREDLGRRPRPDGRGGRQEALPPDRRDHARGGVQESRVGVALHEIPRRQDRFPGEHQDRAPQREQGEPPRGLRGLPRGRQVGPLQDRLHRRVRPVRRPAVRGDARELRFRAGAPGRQAPAVRGERRRDVPRAVHRLRRDPASSG